MKPLGIHMVWVTVKDYNQAKEFFGTTLGMKQIADAPEYNWAEFQTPEGAHLGICTASDECPVKAGDNAVMCITVEDAESTKQELEEKGVRCWKIEEVPGHVKLFFIQDDSGNYYQIVQKLD